MMKLDTSKYNSDFTNVKKGDKVLYESGHTYSHSNLNYSVKEVIAVTKTSFRIDDIYLFKKDGGKRRGLSGMQNWSTVSRCYLLTDTQLKEVVLKINEANLRNKLIMSIEANVTKIKSLSTKDLELIESKLNK